MTDKLSFLSHFTVLMNELSEGSDRSQTRAIRDSARNGIPVWPFDDQLIRWMLLKDPIDVARGELAWKYLLTLSEAALDWDDLVTQIPKPNSHCDSPKQAYRSHICDERESLRCRMHLRTSRACRLPAMHPETRFSNYVTCQPEATKWQSLDFDTADRKLI